MGAKLYTAGYAIVACAVSLSGGKGGWPLERQALMRAIKAKQRELARLVKIKRSLQDEEVYRKSCELDKLVVAYMRKQS
ncbi:hypothetical protein SY88_19320 [Clostridiales bacterium PH28_bin88]|nr:hypothetical protein SY88_19320 [Clostridiales bacterium PH28_bin88]